MKSRLSSTFILCCAVLPIPALQSGGNAQEVNSIRPIPTLGGTTLNVNSLNQKGQMTGFSYTPGNASNHAFLYTDDIVLDLGTLGGLNSIGFSLNALGYVVGQSYVDKETSHAFLFNGATLLDLGTLGGSSSRAVGINDARQVAGTSSPGGSANEAFLYSNGKMVGLGDLGGGSSQAVAINNLGTVIGDSSDGTSSLSGFIYKAEKMEDLGSFGGGYTYVTALNNLDMVVGESGYEDWTIHAFLYADGTLTDIGTLGGGYSTAVGINDFGQVIGTASLTDDLEEHGFIYTGGLMIDLGTLGGSWSEPWAINNAGQVVGLSGTANGLNHAFLWQQGTMTDLNTLLPSDSGWELSDARFINDAGQVVGMGNFNGTSAWYLLKLGTANRPPTAIVASEVTTECQTPVTIDGSASTDPDGDALSFEWTEASAVLGNESKLTTSFSLGNHTVTLRVADPSGASAEATVIVHAVDTTPPTVTCPLPVTASADSGCQAAVPDFTANLQVTDNCSRFEELRIVQDPPAGTLTGPDPQTVTLTVTDSSGNSTTCITLFAVADTTAPVITLVAATPGVLTPPNHQRVPVKVSVLASDACDAALVSRIVSVTCNEATSPGEIQVTGPLTLALEASRDSSGKGRVYTIKVRCADAAGNFSLGSVQVTVPKGHGNGGGSGKK